MANATMQHIDLDTGLTRISRRNRVGDPALALHIKRISDTLDGDVPKVGPRLLEDPYFLRLSVDSKALLATIFTPIDGMEVPVTTIGILPEESDDRGLWDILHQPRPYFEPVTGPSMSPAAPWCASRLEIGSVLDRHVVEWLGEFENCLAWAWLAYCGFGYESEDGYAAMTTPPF